MWEELEKINAKILAGYKAMSPELLPGYDALMKSIPEEDIGAELPK